MSEIIGIDHSKAILDRVTQRLSEKGVHHINKDGHQHTYEGMGNMRRATITTPQLDNAPSDEEAEALYSDWLSDVEHQLRNPTNT